MCWSVEHSYLCLFYCSVLKNTPVSGNGVTSWQLGQTCVVYHAFSELLSISLSLEGQRSWCMVIMKTLPLHHTFIIFLHYYITHTSASFQKQPSAASSCVNDVFPCYILVRDTSGNLSIYTCSQMCPRPPAHECLSGVISFRIIWWPQAIW